MAEPVSFPLRHFPPSTFLTLASNNAFFLQDFLGGFVQQSWGETSLTAVKAMIS